MANNYSVSTDLEVRSNFSSYIEAGIKENLKLVDVAYGVSPKGREFLSFYVEDEHGDKMSHTEWQVGLSKPFDAMSDQEKQAYLSSVDTQKRRVGQIVTTFIPREKYSFVANTFKEFAENIIRILDQRDKDQLFRAKIVYGNKNWTTFPNYWKYTFIESMSVPKEESKIRILNIDNMVKKAPDVESNPIEDAGIPDTKETSNTDLPF